MNVSLGGDDSNITTVLSAHLPTVLISRCCFSSVGAGENCQDVGGLAMFRTLESLFADAHPIPQCWQSRYGLDSCTPTFFVLFQSFRNMQKIQLISNKFNLCVSPTWIVDWRPAHPTDACRPVTAKNVKVGAGTWRDSCRAPPCRLATELIQF